MMAWACFSVNSKRGDQALARFLRCSRGADQLDHGVEILDGFLESKQDMLPLARFA